MKSFKNHIKNLHQSEWDYYYPIQQKEIKIPFGSTLSHTDFVKKYFKRSGKGEMLNFIKILPNKELNHERTKHTNSIFFLGILLYEKSNLNHEFFENINNAEYRRFPFLWFLTCLFHDFAFTHELDENTANGISNLEDLKEKYNIDNCLLKTNASHTHKILTSNIENYFNLRLNTKKCIDHGVFGGLYFYDRLVKIRQYNRERNDNERFWGIELLEQYAQAAMAIAVHNMWIPKEDKNEAYRKFGLDDLIDKYKPIKFTEFPLLYILGIVDSIDPIKAFKDYDLTPDYILRNILMSFNENIFEIRKRDGSNLVFSEIEKRANNLNNWLDVDIFNSKDYLKITIK